MAAKQKPEDPSVGRAVIVSVLIAKQLRPDWWAVNAMDWEHLVTRPHWRYAKPLLRVDPELVSSVVERVVAGRSGTDSETDAWLCLGLVRYHLGDYAGALSAFEYQLGRKEDLRAIYNCGRCFHRLGRLDEARSAFRQVLALKPGDERAQTALAALDS